MKRLEILDILVKEFRESLFYHENGGIIDKYTLKLSYTIG